MRTVVSNREIPHLWAHQSQDSARNGGESFHFSGEVIYSYREPIGRITTAKGGHRVALFRNRKFSITTSGHQSRMRMAANHLPCFDVADIGTPSHAVRVNHKANLTDYRERITSAALAARRARSNAEWRLRALTALVDEANAYSAAFGLATRFAVPSDTDLATIAERAKAAQARMTRLERKRREEAEEKQRKELAELRGETLQGWFGGFYAPSLHRLPEAYLRISADGKEVETTLGARVPLAHVQRALPIVLRLIERGEAYQRNGHTIHLGHYALDSISADGTVRAGCHTFHKSEIERFAKIVESLPYLAPEPEPATA